ncbi:MAG: pyrroline-5-carboxylate reductase [Planctomycetota bacterium]|nr:pyrroline-5-carboxylate reductase [Planctomycetota bacterium]
MGTTAWIGFGTMGTAVLREALRAGVFDAKRVVVCDPNPTRLDAARELGCQTATTTEALNVSQLDLVFLAVKPQVWASVSSELSKRNDRESHPLLVISVMGGVTAKDIEDAAGTHSRAVRCMPNTPVQIQVGLTAIASGPRATSGDLAFARRLFETCGQVVDLDESLIDAATAVSGSGPAYVFLLAGAMRDAAIELGISADKADEMVRQTLIGASTLLSRSPESAEALRAAVTSQGGTTHAAITEMESLGFRKMIQRGITAARDRGRSLGSGH